MKKCAREEHLSAYNASIQTVFNRITQRWLMVRVCGAAMMMRKDTKHIFITE